MKHESGHTEPPGNAEPQLGKDHGSAEPQLGPNDLPAPKG